MATSLLATKLFVPPARPGLVSRPRLMERMQAAINHGLTLISAPAGSGKTTLASDWTRHIGKDIGVAWLSLDDGDNDPTRFWDYVIASIKTVRPDVGDAALSLLHSGQPYSSEPLLTNLINDLAGMPNDLALVLDDYHLINAEAVHRSVIFLLEHLPPSMHVVIATRAEPPLPLSTFRGRGMILEIGPDDLRFTVDETGALLRHMQSLELQSEDVRVLNERTEGWAVGLTMSALSIGRQRDAHAFIASFAGSQRHIMEYLADEVLKRQPDEVRDFLLKTSILDRLTGPLCDHVSGLGGGQAMLQRLEKANLFLVPLDESGEWYRYHHLFAELLRHQLESTSDAEEIGQLHRRASEWYDAHHYPDDAIRHALKIQDWERATALITQAADNLVKRGEWSTLSGWLRAVPEEVLRVQPRAYAHYANVLATSGKLDAAEAVLAYLDRMPDLEGSLRGELAFLRMEVAYRRGDTKQTYELGGRAVELLGEASAVTRARALHILAVLDLIGGRLGLAQAREVEVVRIARRAGESWVAGTAASNLGNILWLRGKVRQGRATAKQALEIDERSVGTHGVLGIIQYELNELEEATRSLRTAVELSELSGYAEQSAGLCYYLAQCLLAKGNDAEAEDVMAKADEASRHPNVSPFFRVWHVANRVMFAVQRSDVKSAETWGRQLADYPADILWIGSLYVPPRLLIATGESEAAAEQLSSLYAQMISSDALSLVVKVRVCQALAAPTQDEALVFLADALQNGEPEGYVRTFVDEGMLLAPLLRRAVSSGIEPEYARKLLAIIQAEEQHRQAATAKGVPIPQSSEFLSQRELEVLRLAAEGLSNRQIAEKLTVTLSTAKAHLHNITGKLGAHNRTQAIARARELRLI